ncbi:hypothetical protein U1Q18_040666 [Sarracenia purpurea var. burkii]
MAAIETRIRRLKGLSPVKLDTEVSLARYAPFVKNEIISLPSKKHEDDDFISRAVKFVSEAEDPLVGVRDPEEDEAKGVDGGLVISDGTVFSEGPTVGNVVSNGVEKGEGVFALSDPMVQKQSPGHG